MLKDEQHQFFKLMKVIDQEKPSQEEKESDNVLNELDVTKIEK